MLAGLAVGSGCTWLDRHRFEGLLTEPLLDDSISQTLSEQYGLAAGLKRRSST
jgi:hypothetical protein